MTDEERKSHNMKRRIKQQIAIKTEDKVANLGDEAHRRLKEQNAKKAEAARLRYHRMVFLDLLKF